MLTRDAVRLVVQRATAVAPGFALTIANPNAVADICRAWDGLPLAIERAAGRISVLHPHEIAERLGDRFQLLASADRTAICSPHHTTFGKSVDELPVSP